MEIKAKLKIDCKDNKCYCCDFKHVQRLSDTEVDVWCPVFLDELGEPIDLVLTGEPENGTYRCRQCLKAGESQMDQSTEITGVSAVIAGGRNYELTKHDYSMLLKLKSMINITRILSGGAPGADKCGENWGKLHNIPVDRFPAKWKKPDGTIDRSAGPRRNAEMAKEADVVVLFPGGKGTQNMYNQAHKYNCIVFDFRNSEKI